MHARKLLTLVSIPLLLALTGCSSTTHDEPGSSQHNDSPTAEPLDLFNRLDRDDRPVEGWREITPERKTTPLIASLLDRDKERFLKLVRGGADPNKFDRYGRNPMIVASGIRNSQVWVRVLVAHGGDPNAQSPTTTKSSPLLGAGYGPLHRAAETPDNMLNVRILVEMGADVNAPNAYGMAPVCLALSARQWEVATFLIENGASSDVNCAGGRPVEEIVKEELNDNDSPFAPSGAERESLSYLWSVIQETP